MASKPEEQAPEAPNESVGDSGETSVKGVVKNPRGMMGEAGVYGLKQSAGYVQEEFLNELKGAKGARFYREMSDNSPVIGGLLLGYREVAVHLDWHIEEPEEATANDTAATEFIRECFEDMEHSFEAFLTQALSELTFGWALHEVVYKKRDDGKIGWAKLPIRAQETLDHWEFGPHGSIKTMYQRDPENGAVYKIPLAKSLLFRTSQMKNNPEGVSMLRPAVVPYQYLRRIQEYEAIGIERDLAGLPMVYAPNEWFTSDDPKMQQALAQMVQMVKDVRNNERAGVVLPMLYHEDLTGTIDHNRMLEFELLSSSGARQFDTDKVITRYNQQVAMSLLGDFVTLGHDGVGSYSLGAVKMDLWVMVVDSICKGIAEEFNERAIKELLRLNGMAYDNAPKLSYGQVENVDLTALVGFVSGLANAGILTPDEGTEAWLREQAGMPALDPDTEPIYDRLPTNPLTGLPVDPENPVDIKTGLPVDPDTHTAPGLADATRRTAEAQAQQAEHGAKNPPIDPNDPKVIAAKQPAAKDGKKVEKFNPHHDKGSGRFTSGDSPSARMWVPSSNYGMTFSQKHHDDPELKALKRDEAKWLAITPTDFTPGKVIARERNLKFNSIDKIVSGREEFRGGYDPFVLRTDEGDVVIDGHHRFAMHMALGNKTFKAHVIDRRTKE